MSGPEPATHTGICPICGRRQNIRQTGQLWHHGGPLRDCPGWNHQPVAGTIKPREEPPPWRTSRKTTN